MAEKVTLVSTKSDKAFLQEDEGFPIKFKPEAGSVTVWANRRAPGAVFLLTNPNPFAGPIPNFEDILLNDGFGNGGPKLPPSVTPGGIRMEVFAPGENFPRHSFDTEDFVTSSDPNLNEPPKNRLTFGVPESLVGKEWTCRYTNIRPESTECLAHVQYPSDEVTLQETRISRRLLNRTLRQIFIALGLQVFAHQGIGLVAVRPEIRHLADGAITNARFDIEEPLFTSVNQVELKQLSITAGRDSQTNLPRLVIKAGFVTDVNIGKLEVFGVDIIEGIEVKRIDITLNIDLRPSQPLADLVGNVLLPFASAKVDIDGDQGLFVRLPVKVNQFCSLEFGLFERYSISDLEDMIACLLVKFIMSQDVRKAMTQYLTEAFMGMAQRGHKFWSISADQDDYIIQHFRLRKLSFDFDKPDLDSGNTIDGGSLAGGGAGSGTGSGAGSGVVGGGVVGAGVAGGSILSSGTGAPQSPTTTTVASSSTSTPTTIAANANDPTLANLNKIDHIVVLMMENRSFDHMLGYLTVRGGRADIDGLTGNEFNVNPKTGKQVKPQELRNSLFRFSPHHDHQNVLKQITDGQMDGFLANFLDRFSGVDPRFGMGFYTEQKLPVYDFLASNFVVCDRWFCAHPGPTMPNRFCTLTGHIPELDNLSVSDRHVGYVKLTTIFDTLSSKGVSWAAYEQDISFLRVFDRHRLDDKNILPLFKADDIHDEYSNNEVFFTRLANGNLPSVTLIDPNYVDVPPDVTANDDHPPADVAKGQELVRNIYNALVKSPTWGKTLFIITYDEHGGFFDHVPPPGTKLSPQGENTFPKIHKDGPQFLGVRVPAFIISPWVNADADSTVYDHTSIIKTILMRFNDGLVPDVYGQRVAQANHLGALLTRNTPRLQPATIDSVIFPDTTFIKQTENQSVAADFHEVMQTFSLPNMP